MLDCRVPIVAAPMAGGPTTAALAVAVANAGGFAFLAGGYKTPGVLSAEIDQVRGSGHPGGVNLFVPSTAAGDEAEVRAYATLLADEAARYGLTLDPAPADDDDHHRAALRDRRYSETVLTRVFTGRPARALRNGFVDRHDGHAPNAYPAVHHVTRALRQAAGTAGDTELLHLWAGTGWRHAPSGPPGDIVAWLAGDTPFSR